MNAHEKSLIYCGYCGEGMLQSSLKRHNGRFHKDLPCCFEKDRVRAEQIQILWKQLQQDREAERLRRKLKEEIEAREKKRKESLEKRQRKAKEIQDRRILERKLQDEENIRKRQRKAEKSARAAEFSGADGVAASEIITVYTGKFSKSPLPAMETDGDVAAAGESSSTKISVSQKPCTSNNIILDTVSAANQSKSPVHAREHEPAHEFISNLEHDYCRKEDSNEVKSTKRFGRYSSAEKLRDVFAQCCSIQQILHYAETFKVDRDTNTVKCEPCVSNGKCGAINYDFSVGDSFMGAQHLKFGELKQKMLAHINTPTHQGNLMSASGSAQENMEDPNVKAGLAIARAAYNIVYEGGSYNRFEKDLGMKEADGQAIGDINHGSDFARKLTKPFYEAVKEDKITRFNQPITSTGSPSPFSVIADKCTPNKTTFHIIGIVALEEGKLKSSLLDIKESYNGTGAGLASDIKSTLEKFFSPEDIRNRFVGAAFDGAYFNCNIEEHLSKALGVETKVGCHSFMWDTAHQLELSAKESRGQKSKDQLPQLPWVKQVIGAMNSVGRKLGRGKKWREMNDDWTILETEQHSLESENDEQKTNRRSLYRFKPFSNTRFAAYAHDSLHAFRQNYAATYFCLQKNNHPEFDSISQPEFILRMTGLEDVYKVAGDTSRKIQKVSMYPWNICDEINQFSQKLVKMAEDLRADEEYWPLNPEMGQFNNAVSELRSRKSYQAASIKVEDEMLEGKVNLVREELAKKITSLRDDVNKRFFSTYPAINQNAGILFSMEKVKTSNLNAIPPCFHEYVKLHQDAGFIRNDVTMAELEHEYCKFKKYTKELYNRETSKSSERDSAVSVEHRVYAEILSSRESFNSFCNISKLLAIACTRSHCEAVTEGYGSILAGKLRGRENISDEIIFQEVFVKVNGPKPYRECDPILLKSLQSYFGGQGRIKFFRTSDPNKLKTFNVSKVIDKVTGTNSPVAK